MGSFRLSMCFMLVMKGVENILPVWILPLVKVTFGNEDLENHSSSIGLLGPEPQI